MAISAAELGLKYAPEVKAKAESLAKEIAHEFGLTKEEDFVGLYELMLLLYGPAKMVYDTIKVLNVALQNAAIWLGGSPNMFQGFALAPGVMP